jgi:hypothetical protein
MSAPESIAGPARSERATPLFWRGGVADAVWGTVDTKQGTKTTIVRRKQIHGLSLLLLSDNVTSAKGVRFPSPEPTTSLMRIVSL